MGEAEVVTETILGRGLHGRRKIFCDASQITRENVAQVIAKANAIHLRNRREEQYLLDYYRGVQDIRFREKEVRPDIKNIVMVNRANEIVTFKVSYLLGEPLQYISRSSDDAISQQINTLNDFMYSEDKASKDKEVAEWAHICGVGCRMCLPDAEGEEDGSPASIYTLDPRFAYVVYSSNVGNRPLAGVLERRNEDGDPITCVYTRKRYFELKGGKVQKEEPRTVPYVPIVEYVHSEARMGAFEIVLPLLNAINTLESNRVDDIEQFVQSIMVFENCEISDEQATQLREKLGLMIKSDPTNPAKVYRVDGQLAQSGAQTLVDDLYDAILTICGMPNRNGGSSTSDTGAATIMRDGWSAAESRAKDTELLFCRSEREFLRIFLYICDGTDGLNLKLSDVGMKFTRRNYTDIQSKAQVLCELLSNDKVHPLDAYQVCGLFTDAQEAYTRGMSWYNEQSEAEEKRLEAELERERESVHQGGQNNRVAAEESSQEIPEDESEGGAA